MSTPLSSGIFLGFSNQYGTYIAELERCDKSKDSFNIGGVAYRLSASGTPLSAKQLEATQAILSSPSLSQVHSEEELTSMLADKGVKKIIAQKSSHAKAPANILQLPFCGIYDSNEKLVGHLLPVQHFFNLPSFEIDPYACKVFKDTEAILLEMYDSESEVRRINSKDLITLVKEIVQQGTIPGKQEYATKDEALSAAARNSKAFTEALEEFSPQKNENYRDNYQRLKQLSLIGEAASQAAGYAMLKKLLPPIMAGNSYFFVQILRHYLEVHLKISAPTFLPLEVIEGPPNPVIVDVYKSILKKAYAARKITQEKQDSSEKVMRQVELRELWKKGDFNAIQKAYEQANLTLEEAAINSARESAMTVRICEKIKQGYLPVAIVGEEHFLDPHNFGLQEFLKKNGYTVTKIFSE